MKSAIDLVVVRWLYLRLLGLIYVSAFGSLSVMLLALNGEHGVSPTKDLLASAREFGFSGYYSLPTLAWLNCSDAFLQALPIIGLIASLLLLLGIFTGFSLLTCTVVWLSLLSGGGEFTQFQSDGMLVETGFLTLFIVPWNVFEPPWPVRSALKEQRPPSKVCFWLLRFMFFRLMFAAGAVKLLSGDPTWADLTALTYHFETQPLPTPLAWYADHLPVPILKGMTVGMFVIELFAPWLIFTPGWVPLFAVGAFSALQVGIILTGNYTFLNYLMIVLSVTVLNDQLIAGGIPRRLRESIQSSAVESQPAQARTLLLNAAAALLFALAGAQLCGTLLSAAILPDFARSALALVSPLNICNRYGLFAVMTTSRPEIVFQGSYDGNSWKTYEFANKVSDDLKRALSWMAPHMPRLDWRLWFAAMEPADANPWVLMLARRLLEGEPHVIRLFACNPFERKPPRFIRAFVWDYHFTDQAAKERSGDWWWRDNQRVYLPILTLRDGRLAIPEALDKN